MSKPVHQVIMPDTVKVQSDQELLDAFMDESSREMAFTSIVKKYQERLYWHIRRLLVSHDDSNDVLQNVFLKAWRGLSGFRRESELYTWLYRIATNECMTFLAARKKRYARSLSDEGYGLSQMIKADRGYDFSKVEWKIQLAIQTLPERQRAVFTLRYYDEMPYEKMSEVLETSVGSLKASYHHAVKKIEAFVLKEN